VARSGNPRDGRQVLVSVSAAGVEMIEMERRVRREWFLHRLSALNRDDRATLLRAIDLMSALLDESV
jgi:DNA-binding MarR family transcriptional regulator